MNYRITIRDTRFSDRQKVFEVEADSLATALFVAGTQHGTVEFPEVIEVVKAEIPTGWVGVKLP